MKNIESEEHGFRPVKIDACGTIEHLDDAGVLRMASAHAEACKRAWVVQPSGDDTGCPLDWIGERRISVLSENGFIVIPGPGDTIESLVASRMLKR